MSGGKVVACPRCGSCDPLDTQMQIDYWRGFKFCVMACVCGYGEAAPYCGDFENVSARFYRKEATDLAAAIARAEAAEAKLAAMGQDAREIYAQIPGLPVTPETCDAATDVLTRFCIDFNDAIAAQQAEGVSS